ncbi:hypothetical protein HEK616_76470 (plasmid) [Streptomyces nigrescens]|uniref:Secreted protein n=2 Tax=Streptomyces TaxID=1883 RepID=A0ABN6R9B0_STRNI|nr:hypothetical protein [Streptomyces nigrescens]MEE4419119.1 hypothetical protein [Streptomyces sp. DSM 41528]BDM74160.1 hypothetical protein HEK616_76470 [Streptomyces nigrescens]
MSAFRRSASLLVAGFAVLLTVSATVEPAVAAAPARQPLSCSLSTAGPFVLCNAERNFSDTWDGRALFRLTSATARTGEGTYFLYVPATAAVQSIPHSGPEVPSDWRAVLFTMPNSEHRVEVRFGDIDRPEAAEPVAWVEEIPAG